MPFVIQLNRPFLFDYEKEWFHLINHVSVFMLKQAPIWHDILGKV